MKGIFITVEGPDGAGKTSVIERLIPMLKEQLVPALVSTREPGGVRIAEEIREIILDPKNTEMDERTEAILYAAARRQHLMQVVLPALEAGKVVLCDRFVDSSIAYQGVGRGIGVAEVATLNEFATDGLAPDVTLYLDVPADIGLARIAQNKERQNDRLDQEKLSFHELVRAAYLEIYQQHPERVLLVDATQNIDQVVETCFNQIKARYKDIFKA